MGCLGFIVLVYIIPLATTATAGRYFAMMLIPGVGVAPQIMLYKTMNLHVARPYTKRAAGVALMNAIGGTSNIWGSYLWKKPPRYYEGFGTSKCPFCFPRQQTHLQSTLCLFLRLYSLFALHMISSHQPTHPPCLSCPC